MGKIAPKRYRAKYIEPGIMSYEDLSLGRLLVLNDALEKMRNTFIGMPVINLMHSDKSAYEAFGQDKSNPEAWAEGIVIGVGKDNDGWEWADMLIWDEDTQRNIDERGFSVSCAYMPTEESVEGGKWHNIEYDRQVLNGRYLHMAIVDSPRYEGAVIYANSKGANSMRVFNIFASKDDGKKKEETKPVENKTEDQGISIENAYVENDNGERIPLNVLIENWQAQNSEDEDKERVDREDKLNIDGKEVTANELLNMYNKKKAAENAESPQDEEAEEVVDEKNKQGGAESADKGSRVQNAQGVQNMKRVREAVQNSQEYDFKPNISTIDERLEAGAARYGTIVKNDAKGAE